MAVVSAFLGIGLELEGQRVRVTAHCPVPRKTGQTKGLKALLGACCGSIDVAISLTEDRLGKKTDLRERTLSASEMLSPILDDCYRTERSFDSTLLG